MLLSARLNSTQLKHMLGANARCHVYEGKKERIERENAQVVTATIALNGAFLMMQTIIFMLL